MKWISKNKELVAFLNTGTKVTAASLNEQHAKVWWWQRPTKARAEGDEYKKNWFGDSKDPRVSRQSTNLLVLSRTLTKNYSSYWRLDWNIDTFLRALEEVYAQEPLHPHLAVRKAGCSKQWKIHSTWFNLRGRRRSRMHWGPFVENSLFRHCGLFISRVNKCDL